MLATANLGEIILGAGNANHLITPVFSDICDVAPADSSGQDVIDSSGAGGHSAQPFQGRVPQCGFYDEGGGDSVITASQRAT